MENFFNWMVKPLPKEDVLVWLNVQNMNYEKIELYGDIFKSLDHIINDTYLGNDNNASETKIILSPEDNRAHFDWCWNKLLEDFRKENIKIKHGGQHRDYLESFYNDTFYNQKEKSVKKSIPEFLMDVFDIEKAFTKSDLDVLTEFYKLLEKNID
jgi:hypothetical protein